MPFFDDGHLDGLEASAGPRIGFLEGFDIGYDQQYEVDSFYSLEDALRTRWLENLDLLNQRTQAAVSMPTDMTAMSNYAAAVLGQDASIWGKRWKFEDGRVIEMSEQDLAQFLAVNQQIKELADPEIRSFEEVLEEVMQMRREVEGRTALAGETASFGGAVGQFIGAIAGSFSMRDPLLVATLPVGGFGRTIAARIATEAGVIGAVEGVSQFGKVEPTREMLGEPEGSPFLNVLTAAAGGAVIRGGLEGLGVLARRLAPKQRQQMDVDFEDAQLRQMFENNLNDPNMRAGATILNDAVRLEQASPYGASPTGMARFVAELDDVRRVLGGEPATAIGRVLPEIPFEQLEKQVDFQIVRERSPRVYAPYEQAKQAVADIDARIAAVGAEVESRTMADAVRLVDEGAADEIAEIEARVNGGASEPEVAALTLRAENIAQRVGVDRIMRALDDVEITARRERQRLRASRKAANKRLRLATRAVEREVQNIKTVEDLVKGREQAQAVDLLGVAVRDTPLNGARLSYPVVEEQAAAISRTMEELDTRIDAFTRPETEGGLVDIGLAARVPEDFQLEIDGQTFSVREILDDLDEDLKLEEAMRSCLL